MTKVYELVEVPELSVPSEVSLEALEINVYQLLDVYADCMATKVMIEGVLDRITQIVDRLEQAV